MPKQPKHFRRRARAGDPVSGTDLATPAPLRAQTETGGGTTPPDAARDARTVHLTVPHDQGVKLDFRDPALTIADRIERNLREQAGQAEPDTPDTDTEPPAPPPQYRVRITVSPPDATGLALVDALAVAAAERHHFSVGIFHTDDLTRDTDARRARVALRLRQQVR